MYLTPEEKAIGKENFCAAIGSRHVRRDLLLRGIKAEVASGKGLGQLYFGYGEVTEPVRVGVIGTGDEGCVLIGAMNPKFVEVRAIADIRPYSIYRAFHGEVGVEARPGLLKVFGWKSEEEARKHVKVYDHQSGGYEALIANAKQDGVEAVIIALPLHLHAVASIKAMKAGLHVLCEKLMAHNVAECKEMARVARQSWNGGKTGLYLAVGHQRHYSILYNNAVELVKLGLIGKVHYIRAQWHRGNLPGNDSWQQPMPREARPEDPQADRLLRELEQLRKSLAEIDERLKKEKDKRRIEDLSRNRQIAEQRVQQKLAQIEDKAIVDLAKQFGYQDYQLRDAAGNVYRRPAIEELIRWRLWNRTGGGLMAELGSHQLDAASIFVAAMHKDKVKKPHPIAVAAAANRPVFPLDRDIEDHVFCIFEFPGEGYDPSDPDAAKKTIGMQYSSINGSGFGGYGETVFGDKGTLVLETERDAMLFLGANTTQKVRVELSRPDAQGKRTPVLARADGGDPEAAAIGQLGLAPAKRGYTEQIEHWAWCIRNPAPENQPRCGPEVALADAVVALTTNIAARRGERIVFKDEWFDIDSDETPEGIKPDLARYD